MVGALVVERRQELLQHGERVPGVHVHEVVARRDGAAHRGTVLATQDVSGNPLPAFDGSTWYPFSQHLLLTAVSRSASGSLDFMVDSILEAIRNHE